MAAQLDLPSAEPRTCRQCLKDYEDPRDRSGFCSDACEREYDAQLSPTPRTWLVGEQNPYGADPNFALYPLPENAAGARLARFLGLQKFPGRRVLVAPHPSGLSREWNDPRAPERLRAALAQLESGEPLP